MKIKTTLLAILVAAVLFSSQPTSCEAAGPGRAFAAAAVMLQPASCEAGVMDQLCSHVTSFLDDEANKAATDLKNCKKNCNWKKHKNDLITAAKKKAKDSCAKGEAPDINDINKGLDGNGKARLKSLYDNNSRLFDGTAKLKAVDFNAASSKDATVTGKTAALGKGGNVTDLKSSEPSTPKLNAATEFSLAKTSNILASTKTATATSVKATKLNCQNNLEPMYCTCLNGKYIGTMCMEDCYAAIVNLSICPAGAGIGAWLEKYKNKLVNWAWNNKTIKRYLESIETIGNWISDKYHELTGDKPCGGDWYDPSDECCVNNVVVERKSCATDHVKIVGPSDLILYNPAKDSKPLELSFQGTKDCPCPEAKKIQWTLSSNKVKFKGAANKTTVRLVPLSESETEGDVSVTVTADGVTSAPKLLTVRRPKRMSHPALVAEPLPASLSWFVTLRTDTSFRWRVTDKWGKPLANVLVEEVVKKSTTSSGGFAWKDLKYSATTDISGQVQDQYKIEAEVTYVKDGTINAVLIQELTAAGWYGMSRVTIKTDCREVCHATITGDSPVTLGLKPK